jgi:hypothetical protein
MDNPAAWLPPPAEFSHGQLIGGGLQLERATWTEGFAAVRQLRFKVAGLDEKSCTMSRSNRWPERSAVICKLEASHGGQSALAKLISTFALISVLLIVSAHALEGVLCGGQWD